MVCSRPVRLVAACLFISALACSPGERRVDDPLPDVPLQRQRAIARSQLQWRWPFTVGTGTLACDAGAVLFRSAHTTYALNEAARARGFAAPDGIQAVETSGPPRNPLGRIRQDVRMDIFERSSRCADAERTGAADSISCRERLLNKYSVSEPELRQIEAEGQERFWKPLTPPFRSLAPLVDEGLKLCQ
jgi:hypothetical protein